MKLYKILTIGILTFVSFNTLAQQNSTVPAEIWMCELNKGYSIDDVRKVSSDVQKFAKNNDMKSAQWIFTTFMGDMNPNGFALMTAWTDFSMMGNGFQDFFLGGEGDKIFSQWLKVATCSERNLVLVENTFNSMN